ncbi:MAG: hypothetical protein FJ102_26255 [Deltaproteobacteria bacterium]|nr:hypothetical protein [Deltaproteobacteria bacterium]
MSPWKATMHLGRSAVHLLLTDEENHEILKARLPLRPTHLRAATTVLEGLALWSSHPLTVALGADAASAPTCAAWIFGLDRWPEDTALVRFTLLAARRARRRTIAGVGDFRQLRLVHRDGGAS